MGKSEQPSENPEWLLVSLIFEVLLSILIQVLHDIACQRAYALGLMAGHASYYAAFRVLKKVLPSAAAHPSNLNLQREGLSSKHSRWHAGSAQILRRMPSHVWS